MHDPGLKYYVKRIVKRWHVYMLVIVLFPLYVFIRIIRPVKLIRFGTLNSERMGHFAANTELYLCERDHGMHPHNVMDIFFYSDYVCNKKLLTMWKRVLPVNQIAYYLSRINNLFPGGKKHRITVTNNDRDIYGLLEKSKIHLSFTPEEKNEALAGLRKMDIGENIPFVCLVARDPLYMEKHFPRREWSYHDYRDCSIQNYILSANELTARGYFVVRMGVQVKELMNTENPKVIEYTHEGYRTELLDMYLGAHCHFFISNGTGIDAVPTVFRRPVLYVNFVPVEYLITWNSKSITIFKKHWLKSERRFMSFREIIASGAGRYLGQDYGTNAYEKHGIELIENTPEEIRDAVVEMDERLKGTWEASEEDEELQKLFWSLIKPSELNGVFFSRIGANFLHQNRDLLD
ncbi:TIGR04372 family glycosyltransferase [Candidatus Latescibacterota bacterium]